MAAHRATPDTPPAVRTLVRALVAIRKNRKRLISMADGTVREVRRHVAPASAAVVAAERTAEDMSYGVLITGVGAVAVWLIVSRAWETVFWLW